MHSHFPLNLTPYHVIDNNVGYEKDGTVVSAIPRHGMTSELPRSARFRLSKLDCRDVNPSAPDCDVFNRVCKVAVKNRV